MPTAARLLVTLAFLLPACALLAPGEGEGEGEAPTDAGSEDSGPPAPNCTVEDDGMNRSELWCASETEYCEAQYEGGQAVVWCRDKPACDAGDLCACIFAPYDDPVYVGSSCTVDDDGLVRLEVRCCVD